MFAPLKDQSWKASVRVAVLRKSRRECMSALKLGVMLPEGRLLDKLARFFMHIALRFYPKHKFSLNSFEIMDTALLKKRCLNIFNFEETSPHNL